MPQAAQMSSASSPEGQPSSVEQASRQGLEQAFELFSQMSSQLTDSYSMLEARVTELKGELAVVSAQRMQELAEKERLANRLQNLLDLLPGGVIVIDGHGIVREANPAAIELLGLPLEGELWRHVIARCFAPREDDGHEISLKNGRRLSIATRSLDAEPGQLVLLNDLTETRHLQDQLARHERLSSLGRMVASLAHQIRTPLSAALLYASHLTEQELPVATQQRFAGRLKERLHELEHQVRDMLVFARGELPLTDRLTPNALMQALQAAALTHVQDLPIRWQCDSHAGELLCNRDTLVGALLNLIENAIQASAGERAPEGALLHPRQHPAPVHQRQRQRHRACGAGAPRRAIFHHQGHRHRPRPDRGQGCGAGASGRIAAALAGRAWHVRAGDPAAVFALSRELSKRHGHQGFAGRG